MEWYTIELKRIEYHGSNRFLGGVIVSGSIVSYDFSILDVETFTNTVYLENRVRHDKSGKQRTTFFFFK